MPSKYPIGIIARFLSRINFTSNPADCWEWAAGCFVRENGKKSYGRFTADRKDLHAHRFMYELINGAIPDDMLVRHSCDNEPCVNPSHLLIGTHKDNVSDMVARGRQNPRVGESNINARLTEQQVRHIRVMYNSGSFPKDIETKFGVSRGHLYRIIKGTAWRHLNND